MSRNKEKEIENLLLLLDEPSIREKIKQILAGTVVPSLTQNPIEQQSEGINRQSYQAEIGRLENAHREEIRNLENTYQGKIQGLEDTHKRKIQDLKNEHQDEIGEYEEELDKKKREIAGLNKQITQEKNESNKIFNKWQYASQQLQEYKDNFETVWNLYREISNLSPDKKENFATMFSIETPLSLLVTGVQWTKLHSLERYITALMGNDLESDKQDIIVLQKIYDQLFEMYCLANSECRRLHTQIGEVFDQDNHVLVGSSGAGGEICEVLFDGYKKGEKIRKSLVRVEG